MQAMSVDMHDVVPPNPSGEPSLNEVIGKLDVAEEQFFATAAGYKRLPTASNEVKILKAVAEVTAAFEKTVDFILADSTAADSEKVSILASLLSNDDCERVKRFTKLVPTKTATFNSPDNAREYLHELITGGLADTDTSTQELTGGLVYIFKHDLAIDLEKFIEIVQRSRNAKALRFGNVAAKQALGLAKISAGVVIGNWVSRQIKKR